MLCLKNSGVKELQIEECKNSAAYAVLFFECALLFKILIDLYKSIGIKYWNYFDFNNKITIESFY
jgi:hypothetical protein